MMMWKLRNKTMTALGAGGLLMGALSAAGPMAQAQPSAAGAQALNPSVTACVVNESLISDGLTGPGAGGLIWRISGTSWDWLTTDSAPAGAPDLDMPTDMAFLPNGDIVVSDPRGGGLIKVDKNTGARTLISGFSFVSGTTRGSGPSMGYPFAVRVEASGDILVSGSAGAFNADILRIDPVTGNRTLLTGAGRGTGPVPVGTAAMGLENGVTYLADETGQVVSVDAANGNRTLISGPTRGSGPSLVAPMSITSDSPDSVVVLDMEYRPSPSAGAGALIRVNLATGDRTVVSADLPSTGPTFTEPYDVQYDACLKKFYVLQTGFSGGPTLPGNVLEVDPVTGARTVYEAFWGSENYALLLRPLTVGAIPIGSGGGPSGPGTIDPPGALGPLG